MKEGVFQMCCFFPNLFSHTGPALHIKNCGIFKGFLMVIFCLPSHIYSLASSILPVPWGGWPLWAVMHTWLSLGLSQGEVLAGEWRTGGEREAFYPPNHVCSPLLYQRLTVAPGESPFPMPWLPALIPKRCLQDGVLKALPAVTCPGLLQHPFT